MVSAPIKNVEVKFSDGLGVYPVSIMIDFHEGEQVSIDDLYNTITSIDNVKDIIFRDNVETNTKVLSWIVPRLISEGYFVSIFLNTFTDTIYNRVITMISHPNEIRSNNKFLQVLDKNDIVLVNTDSIDHLVFCRKLLLKYKVQAKIMFNSYLVSETQVIDTKIYDMFPINLGGFRK